MERDFDHQRQYSLRSCMTVIGIMMLAIFSCSAITTLFLDQNCNNRITAWMPLYPEGEIISQTHNFLRPFGMGTTQVVMIVPDSPSDVQTWYNQERRRRGASPAGSSRFVTLDIQAVPEGSQLYYTAYCMGF